MTTDLDLRALDRAIVADARRCLRRRLRSEPRDRGLLDLAAGAAALVLVIRVRRRFGPLARWQLTAYGDARRVLTATCRALRIANPWPARRAAR